MGLEILTEAHGVVGSLSDGKDMRWDLVPPLTTVDTDGPHGVDGEPLVRVDSDTEQTGVGVDQPLNIPLLQIEEDRGIVEVSQAGHVLAAVVLWRVDLGHQVLLELLHVPLVLSGHDLHFDLVPIGLLHNTLAELLHLVRDVAGPLGVVRLLSNPLLDLIADKEIRSWVWVISSLEFNLGSRHPGLTFSTELPLGKN